MRRTARELAFKLIFEFTFTSERDDDTLELLLQDAELTDEDKAYIRLTYTGVTEHFAELKETVSKSLTGYTVDRVYRPDLICIVLGTYELEQRETDAKVVISAAVDLAKKYGTEKSGGFVNGVLARILRDMGIEG